MRRELVWLGMPGVRLIFAQVRDRILRQTLEKVSGVALVGGLGVQATATSPRSLNVRGAEASSLIDVCVEVPSRASQGPGDMALDLSHQGFGGAGD